jgi:putative Holliday junction resolvase
MRYLGIDYGSKRVGLSLSDEEGKMAFPYKIVLNNMELIDTIHNICGTEEVSIIVLGESHDLSGNPNKIMESIEEFKDKLNLEVRLPIYFQKEFMTSIFARGNDGKKENDARKVSKIKQVAADASASALILQRYLDRKNNNQ